MSGAATKLPAKKMLQRHVGPSQRAAEQFIFEVLVRPSGGSEVLVHPPPKSWLVPVRKLGAC